MAGSTEQNPDSRIAELRAKIASLEEQWARALAEVEQVSRELEALESEPKRLSRKLRLTKNAPQKFDQMLEEAKERLTEERKRVVRERYQRLTEEFWSSEGYEQEFYASTRSGASIALQGAV